MQAVAPARKALSWGLFFMLATVSAVAQSSIIFVADDQGRVGRYDTGTNAGAALGSLTASSFSPGQVIGLAYDPDSQRVLLFDRSAGKVYAMDPITGVATVLFSTPGRQFQGGAVYAGLVYGIDESTQTVEAYTFGGVDQNITGPSLAAAEYDFDHVHNLGLNQTSNQLFYMSNAAGVRLIDAAGMPGSTLLAPSLLTSNSFEDVDYFNGDYLVAAYSNELFVVDGVTGAQSVFLNSTQLSGMGVTGSLAGVAVQFVTVPEPSTLALLVTGTAVLAWAGYRRRK